MLAEARGADVSAEGYELYATTLSQYPDEDIRAVIERFARSRRAEGEKAWPTLGDLEAPLIAIHQRRMEKHRQERERRADVDLFWKIAAERIKAYAVFNFNGVAYRSLDELDKAPTRYKGTKAR